MLSRGPFKLFFGLRPPFFNYFYFSTSFFFKRSKKARVGFASNSISLKKKQSRAFGPPPTGHWGLCPQTPALRGLLSAKEAKLLRASPCYFFKLKGADGLLNGSCGAYRPAARAELRGFAASQLSAFGRRGLCPLGLRPTPVPLQHAQRLAPLR